MNNPSIAANPPRGRSFYKTKPREFVFGALLAWSIFQLWYASPLPFIFDFFILNETEARAIHLMTPLGLVFLTFPLRSSSTREKISIANMVVGLIAVFCASYLYIFYDQLSTRPGLPTDLDKGAAIVGCILLLEAARRVLGPMLMIVALVFIAYAALGPYMPDVLAHKGASLTKMVNHYWLSTEGVFGIALGVSNSLVFMFVLFGALLEQAGAGNYFIRSAYAIMGRFKGGPGKAAVAASALTGMVSGSSTANVVTTGTFTIPLMQKNGFSPEKAGAIEVASSTNGQLMPPVMGAAAFLMAEYVGIGYLAVIKHALLPALISYIALAYIVHLEASKLGLEGMRKTSSRSWTIKLLMALSGFIATAFIAMATYYGIGWLKLVAGDLTFAAVSGLLVLVYVGLLWFACRVPELPDTNTIDEIPPIISTLQAGCYFLLPVVMLMWCLTIERLSPSLSAFWATCFLSFIVLTQWPLKAFFRKNHDNRKPLSQGINDMIKGLVYGARNMVAIALATATAGFVVGTVTLTGVGFVLTELIEILSGGNLMLVLLLTAVISLVLGMGLPTTANYIVVSTLMAPVIVNLGAENGLIVPLIAAHLFVFYFGILADDTPPVGLAAYAAAGISGGDSVKTGLQGFAYDIRTAILPFIFLFNTELLLIDIESCLHLTLVVISTTIALLLFSAAVQGYFFTRSRLWETFVLLLVSAILFRPGYIWDQIYPPVTQFPASTFVELAERAGSGARIKVRVTGENFSSGKLYEKVIVLPLADISTGQDRLIASGLELRKEGDRLIIDNVGFDSRAQKSGFDFDQEILSIEAEAERPPKQLMMIPALLLMFLIIWIQQKRKHAIPAGDAGA